MSRLKFRVRSYLVSYSVLFYPVVFILFSVFFYVLFSVISPRLTLFSVAFSVLFPSCFPFISVIFSVLFSVLFPVSFSFLFPAYVPFVSLPVAGIRRSTPEATFTRAVIQSRRARFVRSTIASPLCTSWLTNNSRCAHTSSMSPTRAQLCARCGSWQRSNGPRLPNPAHFTVDSIVPPAYRRNATIYVSLLFQIRH